jgi:formamidopyrimidine-DNA glycosylase
VPELPEVDAIAGIARKYAVGNSISRVEIVRWNGKYFSSKEGLRLMGCVLPVIAVNRLGKQVVFTCGLNGFLIVHNAMTGYFDWEHEPWTFDYVEGKRVSTDSDVRVKFHFVDGKILRFHDARLFGSMQLAPQLPNTAPELLKTPNGMAHKPLMTNLEFYKGLQVATPVKARLMDQSFLAGIGNIYASEACHLAGIDPRKPSNQVRPELVPVLFEALKCSVLHSIPTVTYQWLNVYRRSTCGTCGAAVTRVQIAKRSTFLCESCQTDP